MMATDSSGSVCATAEHHDAEAKRGDAQAEPADVRYFMADSL